eukprot:TRINITY_DN22774_c0_g1_i3.p2 TRINITY_DN22774_c0_g1~~TRINITY_DN22774_c0_g1_i3.p2  ORF type:complete len:109 (+),score=3.64 TRINITY_DN22774_c0_g1_i3:285-611(+)
MWKRDCQRVRKMVISLVIVCSILCGKNVTRMILRQLMKPMLSSDLLICTIADHVLRDTNIGLKYRFNITSLPAIMMIRNGRYSFYLSLIHICRCRRYAVCRSRWSPYH